MTKFTENTGFRCIHCDAAVAPVTNGGYRNHCPICLYSRHLDVLPGDRASRCRAPMAPVGVDHRGKTGFQIVHQCLGCGARKRNRAAVATVQPDRLVELMTRLVREVPWPP